MLEILLLYFMDGSLVTVMRVLGAHWPTARPHGSLVSTLLLFHFSVTPFVLDTWDVTEAHLPLLLRPRPTNGFLPI
ncbi:Uncharacterized protein TCM_033627 [Theobroma cacao]|uniref:Uncharacterized protein n=1 Tax=Theobroma cacao TaxID=3641 RepID=A0A061FAC9_THECC|nr:Uncharacterized protein TCM_033627 [Theobroma cacao]